jgi:hypothetical protein
MFPWICSTCSEFFLERAPWLIGILNGAIFCWIFVHDVRSSKTRFGSIEKAKPAGQKSSTGYKYVLTTTGS